MIRKLTFAAASLWLALGGPAPSLAQTAAPTPSAAPAVAQPSASVPALPAPDVKAAAERAANVPESRAIAAALDGARIELNQVEAGLHRDTLGAPALQELRTRIDPIAERLRSLIVEIEPKLADAKARLDQLGAKPKEGGPERPDVAQDRVDREAFAGSIDSHLRVGRTLLLQAEQLTSEISDRRRAVFTGALFARNYGLFSPEMWFGAAASFGRDARALQVVALDWLSRLDARATLPTLTILGLAIGIAIALHVARRHVAARLFGWLTTNAPGTNRRRLVDALIVLLVEILPAVIGSFVVYQALDLTDLLTYRIKPVVVAILTGVVAVAVVSALTDAILSPDRAQGRLTEVTERAAVRVRRFAIGFSVVLAVGRVLDAVNAAIAASLPLSVAVQAVVTTTAMLVLAEFLRRADDEPEPQEACLGPYIPTDKQAGSGSARLLGWVVAAMVAVSLVAGYTAFAAFLVTQMAWAGVVTAVCVLLVKISDEFVGQTLASDTRVALGLQANLGVRRKSLRQIGVLAGGLARVVLVAIAALLVLAPWGVESGDLASNIRSAFFGFKVGEVTISLSTIILAVLFFCGTIGITRLLQRWLETTFLPTTEMDAGLRNSLKTATGYLGFFIASALAFSYLGLSLEKIAIVAGALSVGIGFGLQSIVNNFVSGLILLAERPIRVGDLVLVGDAEGYVRKISVRATEIEAFDRSTIIVPNSNLISATVRNRVRGDKTGRVVVPINVLRNQDPTRAAELLIEHATAHPDVLQDPRPLVLFRKIGDTWLEFDLIAYVADVTKQARVASDLNYSIFQALVGAKILPPLGPGSFSIEGLAQVQGALQQIAQAIARDQPSPPAAAEASSQDARSSAGDVAHRAAEAADAPRARRPRSVERAG